MRYNADARLAASSLSRPRRHGGQPQKQDIGRKHRPDYVLIIIMGALLAIGAVVVYAIGPGLTLGTNLPQDYYSSKQLTAIGLGIIAFLIAAYTPLHKWQKLQPIIIALAVFVAIAVRFLGEEINGAHRWIQVGGFSFQAAELIKLAIVLWLAAFLAQKKLDGSIGSSDTLRKLGVLVGAVIIVVAGLQSDLGSAAVMMALIAIVAFIAGLPFKRLGLITLAVIFVSFLAIASSPYRRDRVQTFLNPTADCQAEGYQACQALITVGSGGVVGKGVGRSVQAYGYLPEPANDSIFAITAEKFGFVGTMVIVGLFLALFTRIARIAQAAPTDYSRLLTVGVLVWLSTQMIINIGAMIGLLPLKGITLPFVSYGGTSIIFVMVAMGIVFHISRYTDLSQISHNRALRKHQFQNEKGRRYVG
jgi:cell division protein FtsW